MAPEAMNSVAASPPSSPAANGGNGPSSTAAAEPFASVMGRQMPGAAAPATTPALPAPPGPAPSAAAALTKKPVGKDAKNQPDGKTLPPTPTPVLPMLFANPATVLPPALPATATAATGAAPAQAQGAAVPLSPDAGRTPPGPALATAAVAATRPSPSAALPHSPAFGQALSALTTKSLQADAAPSGSKFQGQTPTPAGARTGPPSAVLTELLGGPLLAAAAHGDKGAAATGSSTPSLPDPSSLQGNGAAPGSPSPLLSAPPLVTAGPVSAAAATLAPTVSTAPEWGNALGQQLLYFVGNNLQQATLHLNPPHLGPLEVHLDMQQGQANAFFISSHPVVREAIAAALPQLQAGFAAVGMQLGQATVTADGGGGPFPRGKSPQGRRPEPIDEIGAAPAAARVQLGLVNTFA
ncbi:MAG: flagellar hook-length control protein FliK [Acidithiobacillus sp.]